MRKILLVLILMGWQAHALDIKSTLRIYHSLLGSMLNKSSFVIYTDDEELRKAFSKSNRVSLVSNPASAEIVIASSRGTVQKATQLGKRIFVTRYSLLDNSPNVIGALYWRKGRSQLLFVKSRLHRYGIHLPSQYRKFILDAL